MTLRGPSGLPGKCLHLGLSCPGESALGKGRDWERAGAAARREGRQVAGCMAKVWRGKRSSLSAWFGVRRYNKVVGMREKPHLLAAPWLKEEQQLGAGRATSC